MTGPLSTTLQTMTGKQTSTQQKAGMVFTIPA